MFLERLQGRWPNHLSGQLLYTAYHRHRCYMISPQEAFPRSFCTCCDRRYAKLCWEKEVKWKHQDWCNGGSKNTRKSNLESCLHVLFYSSWSPSHFKVFISESPLMLWWWIFSGEDREEEKHITVQVERKQIRKRILITNMMSRDLKKIFKFCSLLHVLLNSRGRLATLIPYPRTSTTITANGIDLMKPLLS